MSRLTTCPAVLHQHNMRRLTDFAVYLATYAILQAGPRRGPESGDDGSGDEADEDAAGLRPSSAAAQQRTKESLLVSTARARAAAPEQTVEEKVFAEEADIMRHLMQKQALKAVQELAAGVSYTKSMQTGWKAPLAARRMSQKKQQVRPGKRVGVASPEIAWCKGFNMQAVVKGSKNVCACHLQHSTASHHQQCDILALIGFRHSVRCFTST